MDLNDLILRHKTKYPHLVIFEINSRNLPTPYEGQIDIV
jgi:hypothetical protein